MHSQDCNRSLMFVFHFGISATVSVFVRFPSAFFVCVRHNQSGYLASKTTNTSSYSIKSRIKQLFALQTYEKKVAEFPFLLRSIFP